MTLPARFLAYGAYNLANDRYMGKPANGVGPIFFKYLRDGGWPVNLVRLIVFRHSGQDGLADVRRLSLYTPQQAINTSYIDQLVNTVDQARQFGFHVQVCLFSHTSIVGGEQPEHAPSILGLPEEHLKPSDPREAIRQFCNVNNAARLQEQIKLVRAVGDRLRVFPNVLWELANEIRVANVAVSAADDCGVQAWLNRIRTELITSLQGAPARIGTSTGVNNERFVFKRLAADSCAAAALPVDFFDFHSGQWKQDDVAQGIQRAKNRATGYNPNAFLIIDDDGEGGGGSATEIRSWAAAAFRLGLHYSAKQTYPPAKPWNTAVLDALKQAWDDPNGY